MDHEPHAPSSESESSSENKASRQFGYFLTTDPAAIVDMWKKYSDHIDAHAPYAFSDADDAQARRNELDKEAGIELSDAESVGAILGQEFPKLANAFPRRAAELVAEILRREDNSDGNFCVWTNAPLAILYIASRDRELAGQMWEMFRELGGEYATSEAAAYVRDEIDPEADRGEGSLAKEHAERLQGADRVAMVLFLLRTCEAIRSVVCEVFHESLSDTEGRPS
jgi:hypothetical protein